MGKKKHENLLVKKVGEENDADLEISIILDVQRSYRFGADMRTSNRLKRAADGKLVGWGSAWAYVRSSSRSFRRPGVFSRTDLNERLKNADFMPFRVDFRSKCEHDNLYEIFGVSCSVFPGWGICNKVLWWVCTMRNQNSGVSVTILWGNPQNRLLSCSRSGLW